MHVLQQNDQNLALANMTAYRDCIGLSPKGEGEKPARSHPKSTTDYSECTAAVVTPVKLHLL